MPGNLALIQAYNQHVIVCKSLDPPITSAMADVWDTDDGLELRASLYFGRAEHKEKQKETKTKLAKF